jgi:hypothetical protein
MTSFCRRLMIAAACSLIAGNAAPHSQSSATGKTRQLFVNASTGTGSPVLDLGLADFDVEDGGVKRTVVRAALATTPMRIALMVDTSDAAASALTHMRSGLLAFLDALSPEQEVVLITTGRQMRVRDDGPEEAEGRGGRPVSRRRGHPLDGVAARRGRALHAQGGRPLAGVRDRDERRHGEQPGRARERVQSVDRRTAEQSRDRACPRVEGARRTAHVGLSPDVHEVRGRFRDGHDRTAGGVNVAVARSGIKMQLSYQRHFQ